MNRKFNDRGVTLIEVIIVSALVLVVLSLAYNIFFLSNRSFQMGVNQAQIQHDGRMISIFITDELKTAKEISSNPLTGEHKRIILKAGNIVLETADGENYREIKRYGNNIENVEFYSDNETFALIHIKISFKGGKEIKNSVHLVNLHLQNERELFLEKVDTIYFK